MYGAYGFVGEQIARMAVENGLHPIVAGRKATRVERLAAELDVAYHVFKLDDVPAMDRALKDVRLVLHCAGPYLNTYKQMVEGCLRAGVHYLDLTGELPVYEAIAARDGEARAQGVMLLPGVGFDVVATDCLALHLNDRLPHATHLTLAFQARGPAGLPPGTQRTSIELAPYGDRMRRDGKLVAPQRAEVTRQIDFGDGPVEAVRFTWGDVFTGYHSTGIPNIEVYAVLSQAQRRQFAWLRRLRPLFKLAAVRSLFKLGVKPGSTAEERAQSSTHVWGEVKDDQGGRAVSRLHGPEAAVVWTARAALAAVQKVLAGKAPPGYQTPAKAYGADLVLECEGVTREDLN